MELSQFSFRKEYNGRRSRDGAFGFCELVTAKNSMAVIQLQGTWVEIYAHCAHLKAAVLCVNV